MSAIAIILAAASGGFGALALVLSGTPPYVSAFAAVAGAAWIAVLAFRPKAPIHGLFLFLTLAAAGAAAVQGRLLLGLVACTTGLFAWDAATMQRFFSQLPPRGRRSAASRYAAHALATAAVALGVPSIALVIRPRLGFPVALGLSLGAIAALGVALWLIGRVFSASDGAQDDEEEAARCEGKEEGAGDS